MRLVKFDEESFLTLSELKQLQSNNIKSFYRTIYIFKENNSVKVLMITKLLLSNFPNNLENIEVAMKPASFIKYIHLFQCESETDDYIKNFGSLLLKPLYAIVYGHTDAKFYHQVMATDLYRLRFSIGFYSYELHRLSHVVITNQNDDVPMNRSFIDLDVSNINSIAPIVLKQEDTVSSELKYYHGEDLIKLGNTKLAFVDSSDSIEIGHALRPLVK